MDLGVAGVGAGGGSLLPQLGVWGWGGGGTAVSFH